MLVRTQLTIFWKKSRILLNFFLVTNVFSKNSPWNFMLKLWYLKTNNSIGGQSERSKLDFLDFTFGQCLRHPVEITQLQHSVEKTRKKTGAKCFAQGAWRARGPYKLIIRSASRPIANLTKKFCFADLFRQMKILGEDKAPNRFKWYHLPYSSQTFMSKRLKLCAQRTNLVSSSAVQWGQQCVETYEHTTQGWQQQI